ncbi:ORF6N domain-containing protein [Xenorhabdus bovienii]|uniref:ORF6N domain-containing protein n=1 Tax=Xenorhabdus bovienii TaxID=40576 RepID=UPI0023B2080F|nr:ORF6N domain-containing protein [Xenorhabdus bovienii]MDE9570335.1 ORF6N domain-containing protein [Xenorhabdus bovienii]
MSIVSTVASTINNSVRSLPPVMHNSIPVITTELLAQLYETNVNNIKVNHSRNTERFIEGKHYFKLTGSILKEFKHKVTQSNFVKVAQNVRHLTLWTERGAARHAKMLDTDKAWDVFEALEDHYFNQKKDFPTPKAETTHTIALTSSELCTLSWLYKAAMHMSDEMEIVQGALSQLNSPYGRSMQLMTHSYKHTLSEAKRIIAREVSAIDSEQLTSPNWQAVLTNLKH